MTRFTIGLPIRRVGEEGGFADPGFVRDAIALAEDGGFWGLTAPDHIVAPNAWARAGGGEQWTDPFVLLGFAAAMTNRLRLITHVVVLPYRNPLAVAKALASLDHLSNGRAVLGVGSGYLKEEFDILGVPFEERGARTDEGLRLIVAAWTAEGDIEFAGRFWSIGEARMGPGPVQLPRPPIWIGGNSMRAVRRAVELGDCWAPFDVTDEQIADATRQAEKLGRRIELALPLGRVERTHGAEGYGARIEELRALAAGYVKCGFGGETPAEWLANAEWFAKEFVTPA